MRTHDSFIVQGKSDFVFAGPKDTFSPNCVWFFMVGYRPEYADSRDQAFELVTRCWGTLLKDGDVSAFRRGDDPTSGLQIAGHVPLKGFDFNRYLDLNELIFQIERRIHSVVVSRVAVFKPQTDNPDAEIPVIIEAAEGERRRIFHTKISDFSGPWLEKHEYDALAERILARF